jgi:hypothetical protein
MLAAFAALSSFATFLIVRLQLSRFAYRLASAYGFVGTRADAGDKLVLRCRA